MPTKTEQYQNHLHTIALTVNETNRFQPVVYWTPGDEPLEFGVIDTDRTDEFGDPVAVAMPHTFMQAVETAYSWTLTPEKAQNDWPAWAR